MMEYWYYKEIVKQAMQQRAVIDLYVYNKSNTF